LFLTALEVAIVIGPETEYSTTVFMQLSQKFMNVDPSNYTPPQIGELVLLYNIPELQAFISNTVNNYYTMDAATNLDRYLPNTDDDGQIVPV
jgi:hypothetical protein